MLQFKTAQECESIVFVLVLANILNVLAGFKRVVTLCTNDPEEYILKKLRMHKSLKNT